MKNAKVRNQILQVVGDDMFKQVYDEKAVKKRKIVTYREFKDRKGYIVSDVERLESNLTYHHIRHKSEGGKATFENGAMINELAHRYLHSLDYESEMYFNRLFQLLKLEKIHMNNMHFKIGLDGIEQIRSQAFETNTNVIPKKIKAFSGNKKEYLERLEKEEQKNVDKIIRENLVLKDNYDLDDFEL